MDVSGSFCGGMHARHSTQASAAHTALTSPHPSSPSPSLPSTQVVGHLREVLHKNELRKIMDGIPIFQDLRPDQRQKFSDYMDRRHLVVKEAGEPIYTQGDASNACMYIVRKGRSLYHRAIMRRGPVEMVVRRRSVSMSMLWLTIWTTGTCVAHACRPPPSTLPPHPPTTLTSPSPSPPSLPPHCSVMLPGMGTGLVPASKDVRVLKTPSYFGEAGFLQDIPREETAVAVEYVELLKISRELVVKLLGSMSVLADGATARRDFERRKAIADSFKLEDLQIHNTVGSGTFGRVRMVTHTPTNVMYALKSMRKLKLIDLKQVEHAINEKRILAAINHPFLNQLVSVMWMRTLRVVHLMLELCLGGELFTCATGRCFDLSTATFYSACRLRDGSSPLTQDCLPRPQAREPRYR